MTKSIHNFNVRAAGEFALLRCGRREPLPRREAGDFVRQIDRVDPLLAEDIETGGGDPRLLVRPAENRERERRRDPFAALV